MKISFCCFTCLIGEDAEKDPEESRLISNAPTNDDVKHEQTVTEVPESSKSPEVAEKSDVKSPEESRKTRSDKFRRAAGITKRYNVKSRKYDMSTDSAFSEDTCLRLKIAVKIMPRGGMAKVFAIDVFNVFSALSSDVSQDSVEDRPIVQLRTKVLPSDIRGHSRKYEVQESITGSLKFTNECLHTISLQEFQTSSIRFRLYHVFKHQRDHLLGEYVLDDAKLDLDYGGSTTNIELFLHDPSATDIRPPELSDVRRSISSSTSGSQNSSQSRSSFQTTIRKSDTKKSSRGTLPSFQTSSDNDDVSESTEASDDRPSYTRKKKSLFQTIRKAGSDREAEVTGDVAPVKKEKVDKVTALEWLRKANMERTEKVSELQHATEEMEQSAGNFSAVSVRLREKYEKKHKKKHSQESN
uniref:Uncharacterized protein LOC100175316 n=1 Tax=Phallusia mammillata TaxID=59560 RepID=A0A6F9DGR8_9ASCI|nr:uncharacterized protein LOC100175316 [Phallusia mammillata]